MAYKMPIVCKEIVLPFDYLKQERLTLQEYKDLYGIDLVELLNIKIDGDNIMVGIPQFTKILFCGIYFDNSSIPLVGYLDTISLTAHDSGNDDAVTSLHSTDAYGDVNVGFDLVIDKDDEMLIENIKVYPQCAFI